MKRILILLTFTITFHPVLSQDIWVRDTDVKVYENEDQLKFPWAGGLSNAEVSTIDLNFDGHKDIFILDKVDNQILTFINDGNTGSPNYTYSDEYVSFFPKLRFWALLVDFNCDGLEDIFSWFPGGITVHKNISSGGILAFEPFTFQHQIIGEVPYIVSNHGPDISGYIASNIYSTPDELPSFVDVDNDGDLDILTFNQAGSSIDYHKNFSMETYGVCDSLFFNRMNLCWGYFYEDFSTNSVTLFDTCVNSPFVDNPESFVSLDEINLSKKGNSRPALKHAGSTVTALDMNGDGVKELLIGDLTFNTIKMLTNGGTITSASMITQESNFPSNSNQINIELFPACYIQDVDNDGVKDLIASSFSTGFVSKNFESVWYYHNSGTNDVPVFNFVEKDFLQKDMIEVGEGAVPVLFDYNSDGLMDLIVSNFGYFQTGGNYQSRLALYENTGSASDPEFSLVTDNYADLPSTGLSQSLIPTFGDIDTDGDQDMFVGDVNGKIHFFLNTAGAGNPPNFVLTLSEYRDNNDDVIDVGENAAPQLFDVDRDGLLDLLIGERNGNLNFYENIGVSNNPIFMLADDSLGGVDVTNQLYSIKGICTPYMYENINGEYELYCGSNSGYLYHYDNIDGNLNGEFNLVNSTFADIKDGIQSSVQVIDINNDGYLDLFTGNFRGGVSLFKGAPFDIGMKENSSAIQFNVFPNPSEDLITITIDESNTEETSIEIFNIQGKLVLQSTFNNQSFRLNTSNLNNGIYSIRLSNSSSQGMKKFIKL